MMLVTLLLLFLNSNTHATESYDSLTWELTTYKKGDYHGLKKYTIKNLKDNQNVNIKSKLKYKLKSGADATSEKEIPFNIEVYYPKDTNDDVVKEEIKRMYLDQIKINDIIKNGINNDTFKSCNEKIYPLIYLDRASKDDKIYYDLCNNKFVCGYEKWICYYCTNQLRALDAIDCSNKKGANYFKKEYINEGNAMPQEKLLITIYHGMTINDLLSDYDVHVPYFEQYEDFQKYVKNRVGDKTKIIYIDDDDNYKLIKDDESYKECKKGRKSVRLKYIGMKNLKALKKKDEVCYKKFLQSINKTDEDLEKEEAEEAERIKKEAEEKEKLKKEEEERKRKEDDGQARKKAEEEGRKKKEEENKKKLEEEEKEKKENEDKLNKQKEEEEKEKKDKEKNKGNKDQKKPTKKNKTQQNKKKSCCCTCCKNCRKKKINY